MIKRAKKVTLLAGIALSSGAAFIWGVSIPGKAPQLARAATDGPVLVELFTSQGCSSCPPAEALLRELAQTPGVVAIEWHVDYWDTLVHRGSSWKDPFSSRAFTARQRAYNRTLRGTSGVYTPQSVIAGQAEAVGSSRAQIFRAINAVPSAPVHVETQQIGDRATAQVAGASGAHQGADVHFVRLLKRHDTRVSRGENKGRDLSGVHVALERVKLGTFENTAQQFELPPLRPNETCAIIVQNADGWLGPVLGAAYCPNLHPVESR
ncbi:MAG: DUF1223 domain-containing protein [Pseudomonadota bacterium]